MSQIGPVDPHTQQYRVNLNSQGIDTSNFSDDRITYMLGKRLEEDGQLPEQVYGRQFADRYYSVKHTPDPSMEGIMGMAKEPYRAARMSGLGLLGSTVASASLAAPTPAIENWMMERAQNLQKSASEKPPSIVSPSEINWRQPESIIRGAGSAIGQTAASLIYMLGMGKISNTTSKVVGKKMASRIPETARVNKKVEGLSHNISKREWVQSQIEKGGTFAGVGLASLGMNTGEIYQNLYPNTQLPEDHEEYISPKDAKAWSMAGGTLAGGLDMIMPVKILQKFMAKGGKPAVHYWHRFMQSLPTNVVFEGGTEAGQEFILKMAERFAKGEDTSWDSFTPQERKHLFDAGILGAVGGVGGTLIESMHEGPPPTATDAQLKGMMDNLKLEADVNKQRQLAMGGVVAEQDKRLFALGEEIQDTETGVRGRFISATDRQVVMKVNDKNVTIPRYNAARTSGYHKTAIKKGDRVSYSENNSKPIEGIVTKVSGNDVFIDNNKFSVDSKDVSIITPASDMRDDDSRLKAERGARLKKEDVPVILRDSGYKGDIFDSSDNITADAQTALSEIEFEDAEKRWSYKPAKKGGFTTGAKIKKATEADKKRSADIINGDVHVGGQPIETSFLEALSEQREPADPEVNALEAKKDQLKAELLAAPNNMEQGVISKQMSDLSVKIDALKSRVSTITRAQAVTNALQQIEVLLAGESKGVINSVKKHLRDHEEAKKPTEQDKRNEAKKKAKVEEKAQQDLQDELGADQRKQAHKAALENYNKIKTEIVVLEGEYVTEHGTKMPALVGQFYKADPESGEYMPKVELYVLVNGILTAHTTQDVEGIEIARPEMADASIQGLLDALVQSPQASDKKTPQGKTLTRYRNAHLTRFSPETVKENEIKEAERAYWGTTKGGYLPQLGRALQSFGIPKDEDLNKLGSERAESRVVGTSKINATKKTRQRKASTLARNNNGRVAVYKYHRTEDRLGKPKGTKTTYVYILLPTGIKGKDAADANRPTIGLNSTKWEFDLYDNAGETNLQETDLDELRANKDLNATEVTQKDIDNDKFVYTNSHLIWLAEEYQRNPEGEVLLSALDQLSGDQGAELQGYIRTLEQEPEVDKKPSPSIPPKNITYPDKVQEAIGRFRDLHKADGFYGIMVQPSAESQQSNQLMLMPAYDTEAGNAIRDILLAKGWSLWGTPAEPITNYYLAVLFEVNQRVSKATEAGEEFDNSMLGYEIRTAGKNGAMSVEDHAKGNAVNNIWWFWNNNRELLGQVFSTKDSSAKDPTQDPPSKIPENAEDVINDTRREGLVNTRDELLKQLGSKARSGVSLEDAGLVLKILWTDIQIIWHDLWADTGKGGGRDRLRGMSEDQLREYTLAELRKQEGVPSEHITRYGDAAIFEAHARQSEHFPDYHDFKNQLGQDNDLERLLRKNAMTADMANMYFEKLANHILKVLQDQVEHMGRLGEVTNEEAGRYISDVLDQIQDPNGSISKPLRVLAEMSGVTESNVESIMREDIHPIWNAMIEGRWDVEMPKLRTDFIDKYGGATESSQQEEREVADGSTTENESFFLHNYQSHFNAHNDDPYQKELDWGVIGGISTLDTVAPRGEEISLRDFLDTYKGNMPAGGEYQWVRDILRETVKTRIETKLNLSKISPPDRTLRQGYVNEMDQLESEINQLNKKIDGSNTVFSKAKNSLVEDFLKDLVAKQSSQQADNLTKRDSLNTKWFELKIKVEAIDQKYTDPDDTYHDFAQAYNMTDLALRTLLVTGKSDAFDVVKDVIKNANSIKIEGGKRLRVPVGSGVLSQFEETKNRINQQKAFLGRMEIILSKPELHAPYGGKENIKSSIKEARATILTLESMVPRSIRNGNAIGLMSNSDGSLRVDASVLEHIDIHEDGPTAHKIMKAIASSVISDAESMGGNAYRKDGGTGKNSGGPYLKHALVIRRDAHGSSTGQAYLAGLYYNQTPQIVPELIIDDEGNVTGYRPKRRGVEMDKWGNPTPDPYDEFSDDHGDGLDNYKFVRFTDNMNKAVYVKVDATPKVGLTKEDLGVGREIELTSSRFSSYSRLFIHPKWLRADPSGYTGKGIELLDLMLEQNDKYDVTGETVVFAVPPKRSGKPMHIIFPSQSKYYEAKSKGLNDVDGVNPNRLAAGKRREQALLQLSQRRDSRDVEIIALRKLEDKEKILKTQKIINDYTKDIKKLEGKHNPRITNTNLSNARDASEKKGVVDKRFKEDNTAHNNLITQLEVDHAAGDGVSLGSRRYKINEIIKILEPAYILEKEITRLQAKLNWQEKNGIPIRPDSAEVLEVLELEKKWEDYYQNKIKYIASTKTWKERKGSPSDDEATLAGLIDDLNVDRAVPSMMIHGANMAYRRVRGNKGKNFDMDQNLANYIIDALYGPLRLTMSNMYELSVNDKLGFLSRTGGRTWAGGTRATRTRKDLSLLTFFTNELADHSEFDRELEYSPSGDVADIQADADLYDIVELTIPTSPTDTLDSIANTFSESDVGNLLELNLKVIRQNGYTGNSLQDPIQRRQAVGAFNKYISGGTEDSPRPIQVYAQSIRPDRYVTTAKATSGYIGDEYVSVQSNLSGTRGIATDMPTATEDTGSRRGGDVAIKFQGISSRIDGLSVPELNQTYINLEVAILKLVEAGEYSQIGYAGYGEGNLATVLTPRSYELHYQQELIMERLKSIHSHSGANVLIDKLSGIGWLDGPLGVGPVDEETLRRTSDQYDQIINAFDERAEAEYIRSLQANIETGVELSREKSKIKQVEIDGDTLDLSRDNQSVPEELEHNKTLYLNALRVLTPKVDTLKRRKIASNVVTRRAASVLRSKRSYKAIRNAMRNAMRPERGGLWSLMIDSEKELSTGSALTDEIRERYRRDKDAIIEEIEYAEINGEDTRALEQRLAEVDKRIDTKLGDIGIYSKWQIVEYLLDSLDIDRHDLKYRSGEATKTITDPWLEIDPYSLNQLMEEVEAYAVMHLNNMDDTSIDRPDDIIRKLHQDPKGFDSLDIGERNILQDYFATSTKAIAARNFESPVDTSPLESSAQLGEEIPQGVRDEVEILSGIFKTSPDVGVRLLELVKDPELLQNALRVLTGDKYPNPRFSQYIKLNENGQDVYIPISRATDEQLLKADGIKQKIANLSKRLKALDLEKNNLSNASKFKKDKDIHLKTREVSMAMSENEGATARYLAEVFYTYFQKANPDVLSLILTSRNRHATQIQMEKLWAGGKQGILDKLDAAGSKHDQAIAGLSNFIRGLRVNLIETPPNLSKPEKELWSLLTSDTLDVEQITEESDAHNVAYDESSKRLVELREEVIKYLEKNDIESDRASSFTAALDEVFAPIKSKERDNAEEERKDFYDRGEDYDKAIEEGKTVYIPRKGVVPQMLNPKNKDLTEGQKIRAREDSKALELLEESGYFDKMEEATSEHRNLMTQWALGASVGLNVAEARPTSYFGGGIKDGTFWQKLTEAISQGRRLDVINVKRAGYPLAIVRDQDAKSEKHPSIDPIIKVLDRYIIAHRKIYEKLSDESGDKIKLYQSLVDQSFNQYASIKGKRTYPVAPVTEEQIKEHMALVAGIQSAAQELKDALQVAIDQEVIDTETGLVDKMDIGKDYKNIPIPEWSDSFRQEGDTYQSAAEFMEDLYVKATEVMSDVAKEGADLDINNALLRSALEGDYQGSPVEEAHIAAGGKTVNHPTDDQMSLRDMPVGYKSTFGIPKKVSGMGDPETPKMTPAEVQAAEEKIAQDELQFWGVPVEGNLEAVAQLLGDNVMPTAPMDAGSLILRALEIADGTPRGNQIRSMLQQFVYTDSQGAQRLAPVLENIRIKFAKHSVLRQAMSPKDRGRRLPRGLHRNGEIIINMEGFTHSSDDPMGDLLTILSHELMHPILNSLEQALKGTTISDADRQSVMETVEKIKSLYSFVRKKSNRATSLSSLDEFMIDGVNDPEFINELKEIRISSKLRAEAGSSSWVRTAWDFIVDLISKVISKLTGGRDKNAYNELKDLVDQTFNHYYELGMPSAQADKGDQFSEQEMPNSADENVTYTKMQTLAGVNEAIKALNYALAISLEQGMELRQKNNETPLEAFIRQYGKVDNRNILNAQKNLSEYIPYGQTIEDITLDWSQNNPDFRKRAAESAIYFIEGIRENARKVASKSGMRLEKLKSQIEKLRVRADTDNVFNESKHGATIASAFTKRLNKRIKDALASEDPIHDQLVQLRATTNKTKLISILRTLVKSGYKAKSTKEQTEKSILDITSDTLLADVYSDLLISPSNQIYISYMQLSEGKAGASKQKILKEIKRYEGLSYLELQSKSKSLEKKTGLLNDIRRDYLTLWMDIREKEGLLTSNENRASSNSVIDEALMPKSAEMRFVVGELEPFSPTDGAQILHMVKKGDRWERVETFTLKLNNKLLPEERDEFNKVIADNKEFLKDPDAISMYKDTALWEAVAKQTEASAILPIGREHTEARKAIYFGWLNGLGQKFATMGSTGKTISQMLNQIMLKHKEHESYWRAAAIKWSNAMTESASSLGYTDFQKFLNGPYSQALGWLESHPELIGRKAKAYEGVWEHMKVYGDLTDKTKMDDNAKRLFFNLLDATTQAAELERNTSKHFGNKVAAKYRRSDIKVQSVTTGEMITLHRDALQTGPIMVSRRLNRHSEHIVKTLLYKAGWAAIGERDEDEDMLSYYSRHINPNVETDFIAPYATSTSAVEMFYASEGQAISQSVSNEAWHEATGSGAEKFLSWTSILADRYKVDHEKLTESIFNSFRKFRKDLIKAHSNSDTKDVFKVSDAVQHKIMDARDIHSPIPREFYQYNMYDEVSMNIQLATIIANAVTGRGGEGLRSVHQGLMNELEEKQVRFGEVIKEAGGVINENSYARRMGYSKGIIKNAEAIFRRLGYKDGQQAYKAHFSASKQVDEARKALSQMESYFGGKDGPYQDVRLLTEVLGTQAFMILSNPASAFLNFLSIPDIFMFSKGFNKMGMKGTGKAILNVIDQMFGGLVEAFGINMYKSHKYASDTGEMFFHFKQHELPWRESLNKVGLRGSGKSNLVERAVILGKNIKEAGRYAPTGVVGGTRQRLTPRTMLPLVGDPFGYVGRVVNHSIGFGLASVYHDLVKEAADYIEQNKLSRHISLNAGDLGYGRDGMAKIIDSAFFGVEAGWNNFNNKLEDSGIGTITSLAWDYIDRKSSGDDRVLNKDSVLGIGLLGMNEVSLDGFLARPSWMYTNPVGRVASPLLGWATAKMNMVHNFVTEDGTGKFSPAYMLKYMFLVSAVHSPIGLIASMVRDNWDDDITGKPSSLPAITPTMAIPLVGLFINKDDPNYNPLAAMERLGRTTSPYGLAYDFITAAATQADPSSYSRGISLDRRIMVTGMAHSFHDIFSNWVGQDLAVDWASIGRPLAYAAGGNSFFQYYHAYSNLMGADTDERSIADMIGMRNLIRQGAKTTGLELKRAGGAGAYKSSKISMHVKAMERAAYRGNTGEFNKAYSAALDEAKKLGKGDPRRYVLQRFKDRSPRRGVTNRTVQDEDWVRLLGSLSAEDRGRVLEYERSRNYYITKYLEDEDYSRPARRKGFSEIRRELARNYTY
jgi:hypothetical protein